MPAAAHRPSRRPSPIPTPLGLVLALSCSWYATLPTSSPSPPLARRRILPPLQVYLHSTPLPDSTAPLGSTCHSTPPLDPALDAGSCCPQPPSARAPGDLGARSRSNFLPVKDCYGDFRHYIKVCETFDA